MIRGAGVMFYLGTVTASTFSEGINGATQATSSGNQVPLNIIQPEYVDGNGDNRTNLRFVGWVDEWETSWRDGVPCVKIRARDGSSLFIDTEAPPLVRLDTTLPIDKAIAKYLAIFPQFAGNSVKFLPEGIEAPSYRNSAQKASYRPMFGPPAITSGGKTSVLDYLTDLVKHMGLILRFESTNSTLYIERARTILGSKMPRREDDPFVGRTLPSGRYLPLRTFIFGRNVSDVSMKRNYTVAAPSTIKVNCYSTRLKRTLSVRYPTTPKERLERGLPGFILPDEKVVNYDVQGISDIKALAIIAQNFYEQLGRNEIEITMKTRDLASYGGSALDPDLLDCKAGDAIQFEVTSDTQSGALNVANSIEEIKSSPERTANYLRDLGYTDNEFIEAFAAAAQDSMKQPYFRVRRINFDWAIEDGLDVTVTAVNFIEIRGDELPTGLEYESEQVSEQLQKQIEEAQSVTAAILAGGGRS
jgi:hypothetical protein